MSSLTPKSEEEELEGAGFLEPALFRLSNGLDAHYVYWCVGQENISMGDRVIADGAILLPAEPDGQLRSELQFGDRLRLCGSSLGQFWGFGVVRLLDVYYEDAITATIQEGVGKAALHQIRHRFLKVGAARKDTWYDALHMVRNELLNQLKTLESWVQRRDDILRSQGSKYWAKQLLLP
jgi:hypothetical protein